MLRAEELRIGNLIDDGLGNYGQVNWEILRILEGNPNHTYQPIPLTEEWLEKFGFEKDGVLYNLYLEESDSSQVFIQYSTTNTDMIAVLHNYYYDWSEMEQNNTFMAIMDSQYVHQLQNLYFALTSKELTIKVEE